MAASHSTSPADSSDQNSGIISLNPHVRILPVKIFTSEFNETTIDVLALALEYAVNEGADIISSSWSFSPAFSLGPIDRIENALAWADGQGRGGLGTLNVFSAGNNGGWRRVMYPAWSAFAVGAVNMQDTRWPYSCYNPNAFQVDVVAPSGDVHWLGDIYTLDLMWEAGCNRITGNGKAPSEFWDGTCDCPFPDDIDYDCKFGGTSAACPVVAGVASLVLSRDPELVCWYQLEPILRQSAVPLTAVVPDTAYGYGRVDAFRAVLSIARGDVDNNAAIDIGDLQSLIDYLFFEPYTPPFPTPKLGDCDCDGLVDNSDLAYLIDYVILGTGPAPVKPCFQF